MEKDNFDDIVLLLLLLTGASGFGLFSAGTFLKPVREWMLEKGVLVAGPEVVLNLSEGTGLDLARIVIAAGVLLVAVALLVVVVRRRVRRDV